MKTNCVFIKDNTGSQKKLQDIQQRTTSYSKSLDKMKIILIGHYWKVWSLGGSQKFQVL